MNQVFVPEGYRPVLNTYETQLAIGMTKRLFADMLAGQLNLRRVSAPLFLEASTGLNDDLNGVERPVSFEITATGTQAQVVHSLAKWKRQALKDYNFHTGTGLYTDMNAIRRDEELDNLHSIYVDQWDWERIITPEERTVSFLKDTVRKIVSAVRSTEQTLHSMYPALNQLPTLEPDITFITAQELEDLYPDLSPKERENAYVRTHHTVFLMQIGGKLKSGKPHDGRAPDYDDWELNGDLLFWNRTLQRAFEVSSMGIRVSPESLDRQLTIAGCDERRELPFHKALLNGELPYTIGGGIGQSRLCMLLLGSAHIGEVQSSVWDAETKKICAEAGIPLL
jgi:aspartate--ammonia ligase